MGGSDIHCAICGGPFGIFNAFGDELPQAGDSGFDREIIGPDDLLWLQRMRVIGSNPEAFGVRKCFITGPGSDTHHGSVDYAFGNDPKVPADPYGNPWLDISVFSDFDSDHSLAFAFHDDCFILLSKCIYASLYGKVPGNLGKGESLESEDDKVLGFVSKEALYAGMKKLYVMESFDQFLTKVDYGELSEIVQKQYWRWVRGNEVWVSNPLTSSQLYTFFSSAHKLGLVPPHSMTKHSFNNTFSNPFTKFPKEIISEILLYLPLSSLKSFAISGLPPFNLSETHAFWHSKVDLDFPFLYDLPSLKGERNWISIYLELHKHCFPPPLKMEEHENGTERFSKERDTSLVLGLANRRRVWEICKQIVKPYLECLKDLEIEENLNVEMVAEKSVTEKTLILQMPIVRNPLGSECKAVSAYFISEWRGSRRGLELNFWFDEEERILCGIDIKGMRTCGVAGGQRENIVLDEGSWVVGLVLNVSGGSENATKNVKIGITGIEVLLDSGSSIRRGLQIGDKRLFKVNKGMVITGLIGELGNGTIKRLGLLQAPDPNSDSFNTLSKEISPILKPLWHTSLPPPHIHASPYQTGYWTPSRSYDTIPMSFILFSPDGKYDTLSSLKGVKSDPHLRCWGVEYGTGEEKNTGPMDKMDEVRCFDLDGEGGERVIKVEISMKGLAQGVKITTNKNRFAFFGHTQKDKHWEYRETESAFIAGLYISWGYGDDRRVCSTVSILSAAKPGFKDEEGKIEGWPALEVWNPERKLPFLPGPNEYLAIVDEEDVKRSEGKHW